MKPIACIAAAALLALGSASHAQGAAGCDALRAQIEAKMYAGGLDNFRLLVLDADAPAVGRVVGSCELGTKKIVYERSGPPGNAQAPAAGAKRPSPLITECKDGFVYEGGACKPRP